MKRVIKDGGIIIIDIRNMLWPYRFMTIIKRFLTGANEDYQPDYVSIWKIKKICNRIGLKISDFRGAGLPVRGDRQIEKEINKSNSKLKYIAPTLIIKIVKAR